jgi:hypothetical protein
MKRFDEIHINFYSLSMPIFGVHTAHLHAYMATGIAEYQIYGI